MKYLTRGSFGIVLGVGGAAAILAYYGDNQQTAAIIAVVTVVLALCVFLTVDRRKHS